MKKTLLFVCLLALCRLTLLAQAGHSSRALHIAEKSAIHVPAQEVPVALKVIYKNLGSKTDAYNDTGGWAVVGPNAGLGFTEFMAMPFTPKADSHVSEVQVAVEYKSGANQVNLSIYNDSGGAPGTLLAGPVTVTGLPAEGTCCTLAVADFSPVAVDAGTQYWVTADTPLTGTGSDFVGGWFWAPKPSYPLAHDKGSGWVGIDGSPGESAGEVLGTIP